jgi:hypothetical protein
VFLVRLDDAIVDFSACEARIFVAMGESLI